jgi:predicted RNA-binding Zn-ribbon protein involved in translation (DUF1610 family)
VALDKLSPLMSFGFSKQLMPWTDEQLEALYANVYSNQLVCPTCGGRVALTRSGREREFGTVVCQHCQQSHLVAAQNDPLRASFRDYTNVERKEIIAADKIRSEPLCPIDGTTMIVYAQRSLALNSKVRIRCPRCGGSAEFKRLYG